MKYKVTHSVLSFNLLPDNPAKVKNGKFLRDQFVERADLEEAGFDVDFLLANGAIEEPEGDVPASKATPTTPAGKVAAAPVKPATK